MKSVKRSVRIVGGFALLAIGTALLILPGPGWVMIALGLVVLGPEFAWARSAQTRLRTAGNRGLKAWRATLDRIVNVVRHRRPM